ncbi:MAG: hypothetical protein AB7V13_24690, partial [Pseudorhodoplanes sp.]
GDGVDAGRALASIMAAAGNYISRIIGAEETDAMMAAMVSRTLSPTAEKLTEPAMWRAALADRSYYCYSEWPLGSPLFELAAYGEYGIVIQDGGDAVEPANHIENLLKVAEDFRDATPFREWKLEGSETTDLVRLLDLALGRWALDNGQPVEAKALAALGGVSEGRIRNMMSGTSRTFTSDARGIPAHEALAWLAGREEFWNSVWRDQQAPQHPTRHGAPLKQAVFVPVARDDSPFHPGLRRGGGFTIGEKGSEKQFSDFTEALEELQRMPVPYWRRPNESGNWGIVAGIRWERLDASDLDRLAAGPTHKIPKA